MAIAYIAPLPALAQWGPPLPYMEQQYENERVQQQQNDAYARQQQFYRDYNDAQNRAAEQQQRDAYEQRLFQLEQRQRDDESQRQMDEQRQLDRAFMDAARPRY